MATLTIEHFAQLVTGLALVLGVAVDAQVVLGKKEPAANFEAGTVKATKEKKESVEKRMKALGPAMSSSSRMQPSTRRPTRRVPSPRGSWRPTSSRSIRTPTPAYATTD